MSLVIWLLKDDGRDGLYYTLITIFIRLIHLLNCTISWILKPRRRSLWQNQSKHTYIPVVFKNLLQLCRTTMRAHNFGVSIRHVCCCHLLRIKSFEPKFEFNFLLRRAHDTPRDLLCEKINQTRNYNGRRCRHSSFTS